MYNVVIVGAGPVGSFIAIKLAQYGYNILVVDKKPYAGAAVCCTGIISKACYNLLDAPDVFTRKSSSATFFTPSGKSLRLQCNQDIAVIVDRTLLEQALVNKAKALHVNYIFSTRVTEIENNGDYLKLKINSCDGENVFEAETVVISTGYGSDLPWKLGMGKINHFNIGAQAEVELSGVDEIEIYLDRTMAPGGFSWLVPTKDNKGLAGMITSCYPELHLSQFLYKLKSLNKITSTEVIRKYTAVPIQPLPRTYNNRLLVVGEAAGQVKPLTGGGIYYGILCADIAAQVLHQALSRRDLSAANLSAYQKQWKKKLARELFVGFYAQRLWYRLSNNQISYLVHIAQKRKLPEIIRNMNDLTFDWHSGLFLQLVYSLLPFVKV